MKVYPMNTLLNFKYEEGFEEIMTYKDKLIMGIHAHVVEDKQCRMQVVTATPKGRWVSLGWVDLELYLRGRGLADKAIEKIKGW